MHQLISTPPGERMGLKVRGRNVLENACAQRRGFTILELLVALVTISAVASLAVPAFFGRSEVTLENVCHLFARDLRIVQNRAAFRRTTIRLELLEGGDGYGFRRGDGKPLIHPYDDGPFMRRFSADGVFQGVSLKQFDSDEPEGLVYRADGRPNGGIRILFHYQDDVRMIEVDGAQGEVSILGGPDAWTSNR